MSHLHLSSTEAVPMMLWMCTMHARSAANTAAFCPLECNSNPIKLNNVVLCKSYCYFPRLMMIDICALHDKEILFEMIIRVKLEGTCIMKKLQPTQVWISKLTLLWVLEADRNLNQKWIRKPSFTTVTSIYSQRKWKWDANKLISYSSCGPHLNIV